MILNINARPRYVKIDRGSEKFGFSLSGNSPVFVRSVDTASSAAKAGIVPGDFLLEIDEVDVRYSYIGQV